ncbi:MAG: SPOR domain-containing protein [Bacteroidales bacterium]|nr:SPOR domain-containing protein [Bacteroidales bacterium]
MITKHIADLLYHHECVIVPGLGGFIKAYRPAQTLHTTHEFCPPSGTVAFNAGLSGNDGQLANYIASVENISYRAALKEIKLWVEKSFNSLKTGNKVFLEGIGDIFENASGKLEFNPSMQLNFNADSFGLPVFFAKAVVKEKPAIPEIQPEKHIQKSIKYHRLVPETLKWAAVLAPFIAFAYWGTINGNIIDNYVHNYTGMFSWVRSTPGKTAFVKSVSLPLKNKETLGVDFLQSPAGVLAEENISFDPGMISYSELAKNKIVINTTDLQSVSAAVITIEPDYYIIGGAFRDHKNAMKLISTLQQQGYPASIVDTTTGGLYIVSMKSFTNYKEAENQLGEVKKAGFSSSWILKKQKG